MAMRGVAPTSPLPVVRRFSPVMHFLISLPGEGNVGLPHPHCAGQSLATRRAPLAETRRVISATRAASASTGIGMGGSMV